MGILKKIQENLFSIKDSFKRFPVTLLISCALAIYLIVLRELDLRGEEWDYLYKIAMVLGLGILFFLVIELIIEKFKVKRQVKALLFYLAGGIDLILYYFILLKEVDYISLSRYGGLQIFLFLTFIYIGRWGNDKDIEYYFMDLSHGFSITFIYSFVLFVGLSAIFLTIDQLFDASIPGKLYYYIFLLTSFVFAAALFLSKIPDKEEDYSNVLYNKPLSILLNYIVVPLISIYTLILYAYFFKILLTSTWPKGLVSHLVLWYSTFSVGIIFLLTPIKETNKFSLRFIQIFPKLVLPVLFMMFLSIYQRIAQYGITENRYYIVLLGLWVLGIMIYFSLKKPLKNIIIPISLSFVIIISLFGPLSSFSISKYSQNKRFNSILEKNNMILNGQIVENPNINSNDKNEINNILYYFEGKDKLKDLKILPKEFETKDTINVFGFAYEPDPRGYGIYNQYFYYALDDREPMDISSYDYYFTASSWSDSYYEIDQIAIRYSFDNKLILIYENDIEVASIDIYSLAGDLLEEFQPYDDYKSTMLTPEELTTYYSIGDIKIKIIFRSMTGTLDGDNKQIDSLDFIIMLGHN